MLPTLENPDTPRGTAHGYALSEVTASLTGVPFDIFYMIALLISFKDLLSLGRISKRSRVLFQMALTKRPIWLAAMLDILEEYPAPSVSYILPSMMQEELQGRVVHAFQLKRKWKTPKIIPRCVKRLDGTDTHCIFPIPGRGWLLRVKNNCEICLENPGSCDPPICYNGPHNKLTSAKLGFGPLGETLLLLCTETGEEEHRVFHLYHINMRQLSVELLFMDTFDHYDGPWIDYALVGNRVVYALNTWEATISEICVRDIDLGEEGIPLRARFVLEEPVVLCGSDGDDRGITILSSDQLMLSHTCGFSIFDMPPLKPNPDWVNVLALDPVRPTWTHQCELQQELFTSAVSWDGPGGKQTRPFFAFQAAGLVAAAAYVIRPTEPYRAVHLAQSAYPSPMIGLTNCGVRRVVAECQFNKQTGERIFWTGQIPNSVTETDMDDAFQSIAIGWRGSFTVDTKGTDTLHTLQFDDHTGRMVLQLGSTTTGKADVILIVDIE